MLFPPGSILQFEKYIAADGTVTDKYQDLAEVLSADTADGEFWFVEVL